MILPLISHGLVLLDVDLINYILRIVEYEPFTHILTSLYSILYLNFLQLQKLGDFLYYIDIHPNSWRIQLNVPDADR